MAVTRRQFTSRAVAGALSTAAAATLTACGNKAASGGGTSTGTSGGPSAGAGGGGGGTTAKAGKNILIGMNSGLVPQFQRYAADFQKAETGFNVTVKPVPDAQADYIQQLVTQGLSRSLPDIIFNYDALNQTLNASHLLYDLKPWLDSGHDGLRGSAFEANFLNQYRVGNAVTGIPVSADASILYFNKTLLKKYGVTTMPTDTWTYDDLYRVAAEITNKSGGKTYGLGTPIGDGSGVFLFYPMLRAFGSNLYDPATKKFTFANAGGIQAWTTLLKPYVDKFGTPYSTKDQSNNFPGRVAAMVVDTRPDIARFRTALTDDWDVVPMPTMNGKSTTGGGSYSLSVSARSGNKEGAYRFMAWFYSNAGGFKAAEPDGVVPATAAGLASGSWLTDKHPVPANLIPTTKYAVKNAILPDPVPDAVQPKVVPALQKALQQVVLQHQSVQSAYGAAQDSLNALIK